jgi:clan AA aspartic protease (TIGR02281 family)
MNKTIVFALLLTCGAAYGESIALIHDHGTFLVPVVVNDKITLNFTLDSGASDVSVPADVVSTLKRTGTITDADFLDSQVYVLADGSTQKTRRFRIQSLRVGDLEIRNVIASVAPPEGILLLGQSFLSRLNSWSVDNEKHSLALNESGPKAWTKTTTGVHGSASIRANSDLPQSKEITQANDAVLTTAVAFALTGDDGSRPQRWPDCIYVVKGQAPTPVWTFHLNNIDSQRLRIEERSETETDVHISGEDVIVDEYNVDPTIPAGTMGGNKIITHHNQWILKLPTSEFDRLARAWHYIYGHGCTGHQGSF